MPYSDPMRFAILSFTLLGFLASLPSACSSNEVLASSNATCDNRHCFGRLQSVHLHIRRMAVHDRALSRAGLPSAPATHR
jgi:hypothetical protein